MELWEYENAKGLRPRRRAVDRASIVSMPEIWYTIQRKEERSLRYVHNGNTQGGLQEKACKNRPRQNAGRVARFYPQAMCHARWCKGLSCVCRSSALQQREIDCCPDVGYDAAAHHRHEAAGLFQACPYQHVQAEAQVLYDAVAQEACGKAVRCA